MDNLLTQYGIYGVILGFVISQVWPFVRDKVFPAYASERKDAARRSTEHDERVLAAFERSTTIMTRLEGTLLAANQNVQVHRAQLISRLDDMDDKNDQILLYTSRILDKLGEPLPTPPPRRRARTNTVPSPQPAPIDAPKDSNNGK